MSLLSTKLFYPPWFLDLHVETVCSENKHKIRNWLQWHGPGSVFQFSLFKYYKFLACLMFMLTLVFVPLTQCSYPLSSCLGFIPPFVSSPVHLVFSCDCFPLQLSHFLFYFGKSAIYPFVLCQFTFSSSSALFPWVRGFIVYILRFLWVEVFSSLLYFVFHLFCILVISLNKRLVCFTQSICEITFGPSTTYLWHVILYLLVLHNSDCYSMNRCSDFD